MHRLIFKNKPTTFLNVQAQPIVFNSLESLLELKELPQTDGVVLGSLLQEIPMQHIGIFLKLLGSKVVMGGSILISGVDSMELSRLFYNEEIDVPTFNRLMFGDVNRSVWNIVTIQTMMDQIRFSAEVMKVGGIGNMEYYYKGVKV